MKTFKDLEFKPHSAGEGLQAKLFFENGYGVSVVRFKTFGIYGSYTNNENEWELAVLFGTEENWKITYNTGITNDVIGYLKDDEVTEIMKQIQELS